VHSESHSLTRLLPNLHSPSRAAFRNITAKAAATTSSLSAPPADAPTDPFKALGGVTVTRASDGQAVELSDYLLEKLSTSPSKNKTAVVYFMRSFG